MAEIEVRGLTKTFGRVTAVRGPSFTVPTGKDTGFLGPNGSGKTTTLRVVLGLVHPTAGEALIGGVPYRSLAGRAARSARCWKQPASIQGVEPATTFGSSPPRAPCPVVGWTRFSISLTWPRPRTGASASSPLFASHVLSEVAHTASHAVIVNAGELRFAGPLHELGETSNTLESAFLRLTEAPT